MNSLYLPSQRFNDVRSHVVKRANMLSSDMANDLNTYKNFGVFRAFNDGFASRWDPNTQEKSYEVDDKTKENGVNAVGAPAMRSLFNKYSHVMMGNDVGVNLSGKDNQKRVIKAGITRLSEFRRHHNVPLMDSPDVRTQLRQDAGCSVKELVQASKKGFFGKNGYSYADFMYCKYLGRVPNNYLITLRRFPIPVGDGIMPSGMGSTRKASWNKVSNTAPIGTMVTWLGVSGNEMSSILGYSYHMAFQEDQAKWEQVQNLGGGQTGPLNAMEAALNPKTRSLLQQGYNTGGAGQEALGYMAGTASYIGKMFHLPGANLLGSAATAGPYDAQGALNASWDDARHIHGPIDAVKSTYRRSEEGLNMSQSFTVVFEYELKAYNGINPRQAMLDLIANILSVTYTTGGFWGGGYKPMAVTQSNAFQNLKIFRTHGTFSQMMDAFVDDLKQPVQRAVSTTANAGNWSKNPLEALANVAKNAASFLNQIGGTIIGGLINALGRPAKYYYPALLSPAPVGLWHLVIGNPKRPIMTMGNLIIKDCKITHDGPLGIDDFPTNLKVEISFDRGKPRDQYGIEQMYMGGESRIFHSQDKKIMDMYKAAYEYQVGDAGKVNWDVPQDKEQAPVKNKDQKAKEENLKGNTDSSGAPQQANASTNDSAKEAAAEAPTYVPGELNIDQYNGFLQKYFGWDDGDTRHAILWAAQEAGRGSDSKKNQESQQANSAPGTTKADTNSQSKAQQGQKSPTTKKK